MEYTDVAKSPERKEAHRVIFLGTLADVGCGNPDGIRGALDLSSEADREQYGQLLLDSLKVVTDPHHDACIDGRHTIKEADGSKPEVRERHVGGTACDLEIGLNAESDILANEVMNLPFNEVIEYLSQEMTRRTGKLRAAHTGSCGGANGAVEDNEAIAAEAGILIGTKVIMDTPEVATYTGQTYDDELGRKVQHNASITAHYLHENNWDGQTYVEGVLKENPHGVEELAVANDRFHGHAENAIVIDLVKGKTVILDDTFVIDASAIITKASGLSGENEGVRYTQALIADFAKHVATASRLAHPGTPIFVVA